MLDSLQPLLPLTATIAIVAVVLAVGQWLLNRNKKGAGHQFRNPLIMLALTVAGLLAIIWTLPKVGDDDLRGELLTFLGIVLSAAIALSSTTLLGNALAGLMLRLLGGIRLGSFLRIGEHFGRVTERGLIHTEIQTEDRDLTTLPNLYLVTHPFTVIRSSGTIVSATVSLGYDVGRSRIEEQLLQAASEADLEKPFVHILELGDFSVTYRVAGVLGDVKQMLSCRSKLRGLVMDRLHDGGIEIVSPTFMNQRAIQHGREFVPASTEPSPPTPSAGEAAPEDVMFDKAEEAHALRLSRDELEKVTEEIQSTKRQRKDNKDASLEPRLEAQLSELEARREKLSQEIVSKEEQIKATDRDE